MTIKSVREINFFQSLRDRELSFSFCTCKLDRPDEEIFSFICSIVKMAENELTDNEIFELNHMEAPLIASLLNTLEAQKSETTNNLKLTFIQAIYLHNILDYFENHYNTFAEYINADHKLEHFLLVPAAYYNSISSIKNHIEFKLGEMVTHSYKLKHK